LLNFKDKIEKLINCFDKSAQSAGQSQPLINPQDIINEVKEDKKKNE
jgi:hypothetical protein